MPSYILAHDIGTSGNKAALFDEHGALVSSTTVPYATYIADSVCIEQSAEDWWKAVSLATKQVLQGIAPSDVVAIGVSGQMIACLPVDRLGNRKMRLFGLIPALSRRQKHCVLPLVSRRCTTLQGSQLARTTYCRKLCGSRRIIHNYIRKPFAFFSPRISLMQGSPVG